ncbi:hypothetical protein RI367_001154 [Sorochytrium milnesiophthora]
MSADDEAKRFLEENRPDSSTLPRVSSWSWRRAPASSQTSPANTTVVPSTPPSIQEQQQHVQHQVEREQQPSQHDTQQSERHKYFSPHGDNSQPSSYAGPVKRPLPPLVVDGRALPESNMPELHTMCMKVCEEFHYDLEQCIFHGSWKDKMTMCQTASGRFWKCLDEYKYVLMKMGYDSPRATDAQRKTMLGESIRINETSWAMENRPDMLERGHGVVQVVPSAPDAATTPAPASSPSSSATAAPL